VERGAITEETALPTPGRRRARCSRGCVPSDRSEQEGEVVTPASGPKICLIGAGGMSFGPVMVLDAVNTTLLSLD